MTQHPPGSDVCVISTGGTFDKSYDPVSESMQLSGRSSIPDILADCGATDIAFEQVMQIDSLAMTDASRQTIADVAAKLGYGRYVIVHGTSTMMETARKFQDLRLKGVHVFTGAMVPFCYKQTEASFNLGGAIALARALPEGVYVYMHGRIFDPAHARKDIAAARFVDE